MAEFVGINVVPYFTDTASPGFVGQVEGTVHATLVSHVARIADAVDIGIANIASQTVV